MGNGGARTISLPGHKQATVISNGAQAINKAIVDSRLRPQSCYHLANCIEVQKK